MWICPQDLATPEAFSRDPSRVWEFYHYRRELVMNKKPSAVHLALAECEARLKKQGRSVVIITQCIDDLHRQAGSKHVLNVHGEEQSKWQQIQNANSSCLISLRAGLCKNYQEEFYETWLQAGAWQHALAENCTVRMALLFLWLTTSMSSFVC